MTAFNIVRFRVKPGRERQFIEVHRSIRPQFTGFSGGDLVQTGERTFCMVGKWRDMKALVAARPQMIAVLDQLRDMLEDLGGDLGLTDPVSGESVANFTPTGARQTKKKPAAGKKAKKKAGKKAKAKKKSAARR